MYLKRKNGFKMKKYFIIFGILDIITILYSATFWIKQFATPDINWASILILLFHVSLVISAYMHFKLMRHVFLLYYIQIPIRFFLSSFSFSFLMLTTTLFENNKLLILILVWLCIFLEITRLIFSARIHQSLKVQNH